MSSQPDIAQHPWTDDVGGRNVGVTLQDDGTFAVTYRSDDELNLAVVPAGTVLVVGQPRPNTPARLSLTGADHGHTIRLTHPVRLTVLDGRLGRLEWASGGQAGEASLDGAVEDLVVTSGSPLLKSEADVVRARVEGGQLQLGTATVGTLELHGGDATGESDHIERVEVHADSEFPDTLDDLVIAADDLTLIASTTRAVRRLHFPIDGRRLTLAGVGRSRAAVGVEAIDGHGILTLDNVDLTVGRVDGQVRIEGKGGLIVQRGPAVTDVELGPEVEVTARPGSALRRCTGELLAASVRDATIAADPAGTLTLIRVVRKARQSGEPLQGATLRGISLTDDSQGRQRLQELDHAAVVEPRLDRLRLRAWRWLLPGAPRRLQRGDETRAREVDDAAFFAEELAALVHRKAGSGAIRTKASWAAYRGRHLTSQSPAERLLLGLYRLVGYGQRPGPAALLWLSLAAVVAIAAGHYGLLDAPALAATDDPSVIELFGVLAFSPLFLLRLAGDPELGVVSGFADLTLVLVRTVIAAPFVFAIVAVSRLLRADWRFS